MTVHRSDIVELMSRLGTASQMFHSIIDARLATHSLTVPQMSVLTHVTRLSRPLRITDIARAVEVGQPAVTKIIAKFESAGWVGFVTSTNDRRSKMVQATQKGRTHLLKVQNSLFPSMGDFFADWKYEDLNHFKECLLKIEQFLDENRHRTKQV